MSKSKAQKIEKDACVIGAGWSGLYALKHLTQEGVDCIAIESRNDIGGLWSITEDTAYTSVADCTYTTSPKAFTEATDFPWPEDVGIYPKYSDVYAWLCSYAKHFGIVDKISLNSVVQCIEKVDGYWITKVLKKSSPESDAAEDLIIKSKYLIVCTGSNQIANDSTHMKKFEGFTGNFIHSNDVRIISKFQDMVRDKKVVCMGGGENASDLSYYGSAVTKAFTLCVPNGQWMQVRNYLTRNVPIHQIGPITLDKLMHVLPWEYQKSVFRSFIRPVWGSNGWDRWAVCSVNGKFGHGKKEWEPVGPCYANFGNKADLIHHALESQKLAAKRDVVRCEGKKIHFCDGTYQDDVDTVLLCTGYTICFPFLPEEFQITNIRDLYKNIFHVSDPTLAFVGFSRPTQGSIPQLAEMASIFASKVFSDKVKLPIADKLIEEAKQDRKDWEIFFRYSSGRVTGLVDGILYIQQVCDAMGISFQPLEVLFTYGFRDWLYYLFAPSSLHTFIGKLPEKKDVFLNFIHDYSLFTIAPPQQIIASSACGLYDLFYHQLGRLENFGKEMFDKATRTVVTEKFLYKESRHEKWWLTHVWDIICISLIALAASGKLLLVGKIILVFALSLGVLHVILTTALSVGAYARRKQFKSIYCKH